MPQSNKGWRTCYFFIKLPGSPNKSKTWKYPLAKHFNKWKLALTMDKVDMVKKVEALDQYNYNHLMKAYEGGASNFSLTIPPT